MARWLLLVALSLALACAHCTALTPSVGPFIDSGQGDDAGQPACQSSSGGYGGYGGSGDADEDGEYCDGGS